MTARFHKSWADFGGLKTVPQLDYEAATILAAGGVVNIGDQLHPRGTLDKGAYQVIGETYAKVAVVEPWCRGAEPLAEIAVLLLPENKEALGGEQDSRGLVKIDASIEGTAACLMALKHQWNGETPDRDNLGNYKVVIIPDKGFLDDAMKAKLHTFRKNGGAILFSHEATLEGDKFGLPNSPVHYKKPCPYTPSYMKLGDELGVGLPDTEFVNYRAGSYVEAAHGMQVLGEVWQPYFNRAPEHFSSHAQTPVDKPTGYPIAVVSPDNKAAYVYAAIFRGYREDAFYIYKEIAARLLAKLLPEPLVKTIDNVPPGMEIALLRQKAENRLVAHFVHFTPTRRTATNEFIEDATPVHNVSVAIRTDATPTAVYLAPSREPLPFRMEGVYCHITVPTVLTSQLVAFDGV